MCAFPGNIGNKTESKLRKRQEKRYEKKDNREWKEGETYG